MKLKYKILWFEDDEDVINEDPGPAIRDFLLELSQLCQSEPDYFWCGPLSSLPQDAQDGFNAVHFQEIFGEVGTRNMQRLMVTQMTVLDERGEQRKVEMIINDWVDVQDDLYRYLAIDDMGSLIIRIVVSEYLACEVIWGL